MSHSSLRRLGVIALGAALAVSTLALGSPSVGAATTAPTPVIHLPFDNSIADAKKGSTTNARVSGADGNACVETPGTACNASAPTFGSDANGSYMSFISSDVAGVGGGVTIAPKVALGAEYTVGITFSAAEYQPSYSRLLYSLSEADVGNGDYGLYASSGYLRFYSDGTTEFQIAPNTVYTIVQSRVLVDGEPQVCLYAVVAGFAALQTEGGSGCTTDARGASVSPERLGVFVDDAGDYVPSGRIYDVRIWNSALTADQLTAAYSPPSATKPGRPAAPRIKALNRRLAIMFKAPGSNGGAAITNYEVQCVSGSAVETVTAKRAGSVRIKIGPRASWKCSVRAKNSVGWSAWSSTTTARPK
jgi:hypothetical protein